MADLLSFPLQLDSRRVCCRAIVETPKGHRSKFKYDPESGLFELSGVLPEGMTFPFDFGFVPSTLGEDGDPVDILILMDSPTHVGCLLDVRIIGVIEAQQTERGKKKPEDNSRLVAVPVNAFDQHEDLASLKELSERQLSQIQEFFVDYDRLHGKRFKVTGIGGPRKALKHIRKGMRAKKKGS